MSPWLRRGSRGLCPCRPLCAVHRPFLFDGLNNLFTIRAVSKKTSPLPVARSTSGRFASKEQASEKDTS